MFILELILLCRIVNFVFLVVENMRLRNFCCWFFVNCFMVMVCWKVFEVLKLFIVWNVCERLIVIVDVCLYFSFEVDVLLRRSRLERKVVGYIVFVGFV